jgi:hypothetical protein
VHGYPPIFNAALWGRFFYNYLHEFVGMWFAALIIGATA